MKTGTVALLIDAQTPTDKPQLVETISDDQEIQWLEKCIETGNENPMEILQSLRVARRQAEDEFGDYVEGLLSQPFLAPEVRKHGVHWMQSKLKIEKFKKNEIEAAQVIADFALRVFSENSKCTDFYLMGPNAKVRIRIFKLEKSKKSAA